MAKYLVIVESPAKSKTIEKYLGEEYTVTSSKGHIRDLTTRGYGGFGVDIDNGFEPMYKIMKDKKETVKELKALVKKADKVYLATDPDREGEAISWHLYETLNLVKKDYERIVFHEVTTGAHNDFEKATKIARAMVTEYGMSDLGPVQFEHQESSVFLGRDYNKSHNFSSEVAFEIDQEQRKIIHECYEKTKEIISNNMDLLDLIATTLLKYETITKEQIEYLVEHGHMKEEETTTEEKA